MQKHGHLILVFLLVSAATIFLATSLSFSGFMIAKGTWTLFLSIAAFLPYPFFADAITAANEVHTLESRNLLLFLSDWLFYILTSIVLLSGSIFTNFLSNNPIQRNSRIALYVLWLIGLYFDIVIRVVEETIGIKASIPKYLEIILAIALVLPGYFFARLFDSKVEKFFGD